METAFDDSNLALLSLFRRCAHLQHREPGPRGRTRILAMLLACGPITQRALADRLERTPATLSQQLEPLERLGLVERAPLATDRRTVEVRLTEAGVAAAQEALAERAQLADELFGELSAADRRELFRLLTLLGERWSSGYQPEEGVR